MDIQQYVEDCRQTRRQGVVRAGFLKLIKLADTVEGTGRWPARRISIYLWERM